MIAVGLWGAQLGAPAVWMLPVAFPMMMAFGGSSAWWAFRCRAWRSASRCRRSCSARWWRARAGRASPWRSCSSAFFAIFHGHAHGTELPKGQSGLTYSIGFVIATGCLHGVGIAIGLIHQWPAGKTALRAAGAIVALPAWRSSGGRSRDARRGRQAQTRAHRWDGIRRRRALALAAEAHLVTTGLGPIYDGISHVLMSPDDLVPILAMRSWQASTGRPRGAGRCSR